MLYFEIIEDEAKKDENIKRAYASFEEEQKADFDDLIGRFDKLFVI